MTGSIKRLMFLLLVLVMFMTGCTDPKPENKLGEELLNKIQLSETFDETFILPTEIEGYEINWVSKNPDIMSDAGIAYLHEEAKVAYMQANIIIDNQQYSKDFKININQSQELIDLFSIAWEYYEPKLADQTTKNLKLTTRNYGEFSVKYESSDQNIITSDGIITQSNIDQTVTFKITITKGNVCKDYYKNVKVLKYTDAQVAKIVLSWLEEQVV